jgi:hypothetical protein
MNNPEAPRCTRQRVSIRQVGTETLVYDEDRHTAYCLNQSSAVIWKLANGERSIDQIRAAASLELDAPVSTELVLFAVDALRADGLIEPSASAAVAPAVSRRSMLQTLGIGGALLLPAIAAVVAPTAAQAYSGCVDCALTPLFADTPSATSTRSRQLARARQQQILRGSSGATPFVTSDDMDLFSPLVQSSGGRVPVPQNPKP